MIEDPSHSQEMNLFAEAKYYRNSAFDRRFHYELSAIINHAKEGDKNSCHNILNYFKDALYLNNPVRPEVVQYLIESIAGLSPSERSRTANAVKLKGDDIEIEEILIALPKLTPPAKERLVAKLTSTMGQPSITNNQEVSRIRIGAKVAELHRQYSDRDSLDYEHTREMGMEPLGRAIAEISSKFHLNKRAIRRYYRLYKQFSDWGSVDKEGKFIVNDYQWLFPKAKK